MVGVANAGTKYRTRAALVMAAPTMIVWRVPSAPAMAMIGNASDARGRVASSPVPTLIHRTAASARRSRAVSAVVDRRTRRLNPSPAWIAR
jgi:hypothetical protein